MKWLSVRGYVAGVFPDGGFFMSHQDHDTDDNVASRRHFLKFAAGTAAVAAVAGTGAFSSMAWAKGLPALSESDPMAKALHYVESAAKSTNAKHNKGDDCTNCAFYHGKPGDARGPCDIFPGKSVNAKGWCVSHQKKS